MGLFSNLGNAFKSSSKLFKTGLKGAKFSSKGVKTGLKGTRTGLKATKTGSKLTKLTKGKVAAGAVVGIAGYGLIKSKIENDKDYKIVSITDKSETFSDITILQIALSEPKKDLEVDDPIKISDTDTDLDGETYLVTNINNNAQNFYFNVTPKNNLDISSIQFPINKGTLNLDTTALSEINDDIVKPAGKDIGTVIGTGLGSVVGGVAKAAGIDFDSAALFLGILIAIAIWYYFFYYKSKGGRRRNDDDDDDDDERSRIKKRISKRSVNDNTIDDGESNILPRRSYRDRFQRFFSRR